MRFTPQKVSRVVAIVNRPQAHLLGRGGAGARRANWYRANSESIDTLASSNLARRTAYYAAVRSQMLVSISNSFSSHRLDLCVL